MNTKSIRYVLIVDDEPNIVSSVRRELGTASGRYRYETEGYCDPVQALERAKTQHFDVVISDYRMPGMDGMAFLKLFEKLQPDCARIVLSGQTDMDALVSIVNETHIYRFIPKPWHDYYLQGSVAQAIQYNDVLCENKRLAQVARDLNLPIPALPGEDIDQMLFVDDDPNVLGSIARIFSHRSRLDDMSAAIGAENANRIWPVAREDNIGVHVASSALDGLKLAKAVNFSCVVVDFRMPIMNGIDFLLKLMDLQPNCIRILISGVIAQDDLVFAVDSAHIFGFIRKPWQEYELKTMVAQALAYRRMLSGNQRLAEMVVAASKHSGED